MQYTPKRLVLLDIDGLRYDVFQKALQGGKIPHLSRIVGGANFDTGLNFPAISNTPSITYCCQASTICGAHPRDHWVAGNVFFDRFGRINNAVPRKYAFDFTDAPAVFANGLAGEAIAPEVDTLYETAAKHGKISTVAYNMYAHGAQYWLRPGPDDWKLFASVSKPNFGELFDNHMLNDVANHLLSAKRPDVLTMYFFGLDHESHLHGPAIQYDYLTGVIDRQVGNFLGMYETLGLLPDTLFCIFSDHGQIEVETDDVHTLKIGFLFDQEIGKIFNALKLDVDDHLLEGHHCDVVMAPNGGMAHLYLRHPNGEWDREPPFEHVLRVAQAFWEANQSGKYEPEMQNSLSMILVKDVEHQNWFAEYQIYTPEGLLPIDQYLEQHPEIQAVDAANRLHYLTSPVSGDILLYTNYEQGYNFSLLPYRGVHGGLHPLDSTSVLAYGLPKARPEQVGETLQIIRQAIEVRCANERDRLPSNVDVAHGLRAAMDWL